MTSRPPPAETRAAKKGSAEADPAASASSDAPARRQESRGTLAETIRTVLYAVVIALLVRTFAYEPFNIPSGSMIPTLLVGDYLFVSKFTYGYSRYTVAFGLPVFDGRVLGSPVERGDVAVFKLPRDNSTDYIKRIVGLPGDRLQMIDGVLHINGEPVKLRRIEDAQLEGPDGRMVEVRQYLETLPNGVTHPILKTRRNGPLDNTQEYLVPAHHYFAMGDNRDNSQDSRFSLVGYIPEENLVGRAEFLFFSLEEGTEFWEVWKWPWDVRFDRLFTAVH